MMILNIICYSLYMCIYIYIYMIITYILLFSYSYYWKRVSTHRHLLEAISETAKMC